MRGHQYTEKEKGFFKSYVPGHTYKEIQEAFIEKFGWEITVSQVKGYIGNNKMRTGTLGQFKKGQISHNKGKKGICPAGSEKGWFQKGHIPKNYRPLGSERVTKDGYIEIKVSETNRWKLKHRIIWETENGEIPKGYNLIFLDGDRTNMKLEN